MPVTSRAQSSSIRRSRSSHDCDDVGLFQAFEPAQASVLDPEALRRGLEGLLDVEIYSQDRKSFEGFESAFGEVIECRRVYGRPDYFLRVAVADHAADEAFLAGKLSGLPGIPCLESHLDMKKIKADS
ncbi:Lrp/AsnC family transcriptional regulator [Streptomyces coelicoflavus]|uniref:Lrp/AsnC family transcriptional regulator n=1 Tax=Streptomyces coelicoflavus TaxID=285562 RepID=UPI00344C780B